MPLVCRTGCATLAFPENLPIERVFAELKRVLKAGHILVTTVPRASVKSFISCLCLNLMQVLILRG